MKIVLGPSAATMKGVGFPSSETIVGASSGAICEPADGGRTGQELAVLFESLPTCNTKSTGVASL
jgi:hypothetical protein